MGSSSRIRNLKCSRFSLISGSCRLYTKKIIITIKLKFTRPDAGNCLFIEDAKASSFRF